MLIASVVASTAWYFIFYKLLLETIPCTGDSFFYCANRFQIFALVNFIVIPILFGIAGKLLSRGKSGVAVSSFLFSLLIAFLVMIPVFIIGNFTTKKETRARCLQEQEDRKIFIEAHPESVKNVYNPPPCE